MKSCRRHIALLCAGVVLLVPTLAPAVEIAPRPMARPDSIAAAEPEGSMVPVVAIAPEPLGQTLAASPRPKSRDARLPHTRWSNRREAKLWARTALAALKSHGAPLVETVPRDIAAWCPAYPVNGAEKRRDFWVGLLSALSKHESTYRPDAVGGGGLWYGLLQILPATARGYRCNVGSGEALKNGSANLSCAIRIMATTVPRDQVIALHDGRWRGIAADWGPMTSASKRREMAAWLRRQPYCTPLNSIRPHARPAQLTAGLDPKAE